VIDRALIRELNEAGITIMEMAKELGMSIGLAHKAIKTSNIV
jgi:hypothetical protein